LDLLKQYLNQSLIAASNNLRLTTHQLEALGLLRECILNSTNVERDIAKMKTITALSTLGIRLNDIYNYLSKEKIDFFRISEKFKLHSQHLINDLNQLLEIDNPEIIRESIRKITCSSDSSEKYTNENQNNIMDNGGNNKKSASKAKEITIATSIPMPEFSLKLDVVSIINPATSITDVMTRARPTVLKA